MTKHDLDHLNKIDHKLCKYGDRPLTINFNDIENLFIFRKIKSLFYTLAKQSMHSS